MKNNIPSSGQSNEVSKPSGDTTQSTIDQIVKALAYKTDILGSTIFLTDTLEYKQVSSEELKDFRKEDLNRGRHGPHLGL